MMWRTLLLLNVRHPVGVLPAPADTALGHEPVPRLGEHPQHLLLLLVYVVVAAVPARGLQGLSLLLLLLLLSLILYHSHKQL